MTYEIRDRAKRGAFSGAAFGLLAGFCLLTYLAVNQGLLFLWPEMNGPVLNIQTTSAVVSQHFGVGLPLVVGFPFLCSFFFGLLGFGSATILGLLRVDNEGQSRAALVWAAAATLRPFKLWVLVTIWCVSVWFVYTRYSIALAVWLASPLVIWLYLLPFGIFQREVAKSDNGGTWWIPRFPGIRPFITLCVLWLITSGIWFVSSSSNPMIACFMGVLAFFLNAMMGLLWASVLVHRLSISELWRIRSEILSWRTVSMVASVYFHLLIVAAWGSAVVVPVYVFNYASMPVVSEYFEATGEAIPLLIRVFSSVSVFLGKSSWVWVLFIVAPMVLLATSRCIASSIRLPPNAQP